MRQVPVYLLKGVNVDYVAIDFETANERRASPCALGVAVVRGRRIGRASLLAHPAEGPLLQSVQHVHSRHHGPGRPRRARVARSVAGHSPVSRRQHGHRPQRQLRHERAAGDAVGLRAAVSRVRLLVYLPHLEADVAGSIELSAGRHGRAIGHHVRAPSGRGGRHGLRGSRPAGASRRSASAVSSNWPTIWTCNSAASRRPSAARRRCGARGRHPQPVRRGQP